MSKEKSIIEEGTTPFEEPSLPIDPSFLSIHNREEIIGFSVDYWQAQSFASRLHREFIQSLERNNIAGMRTRFYALIDYYEKTMKAMQKAIRKRNPTKIVSTLRSLIALNMPLHDMYQSAPNIIPIPLAIDTSLRNRIIRDLIIAALEESTEPLAKPMLKQYLDQHQFLPETTSTRLTTQLRELADNGHISENENLLYSRAKRAYKSINFDDAALQAFLGKDLYEEFERKGYPGISNIINRHKAFQKFFDDLTGTGEVVSDLFTASLIELLGTQKPKIGNWHHFDLINSVIPRPYQRDAFSIFKAHGYQGQLIEAPTGSGKTLIGMMAIQDWLSYMSQGEAILVLVPTINYEQQWVRELCYKEIGLQLSPDEVFAGTPSTYNSRRQRTGFSPPILVMTYTALAQLGSPKGKGGFDQISVEKFLQGCNIKYVVLDEVHKVVEKLDSVSAGVTKLLLEWLGDSSIEGLIGFSGTAEAFRENFDRVGLKLTYIMPYADLIAYGFVAPFAEFGIPFSYSDRETEVLQLLDLYKEEIRAYVSLLGSKTLRSLFSEIPMKERIRIGKDILDMYYGRKDRVQLIRKRFKQWEKGEEIGLMEIQLVIIIQIAYSLTDNSLLLRILSGIPVSERSIRMSQFERILYSFRSIREKLLKLIFYSDIVPRLSKRNFGYVLDIHTLDEVSVDIETRQVRRKKIRDVLSTSFIGLFLSLRSIYYRLGEGLVDSINAVLYAEKRARKPHGVVVFGQGKRIEWEYGVANPGFAGVAGIFAQMLGQRGITPMGVLSSEIYLPKFESNPLPLQISKFIRKSIMCDELGRSFSNLLVQGIALERVQLEEIRDLVSKKLMRYLETHRNIRAPRNITFKRKVLKEIKNELRRMKLRHETQLIQRLDLKNSHMKKWLRTFFDYGIIASRFIKANTAILQQADGKQFNFFVVKMDQGERKQLMYDLVARIMDAKKLPINVIIVSSWARTGWNVITPNVLIDATATRNVTAWQQLRGRTMRAMHSWKKECYEAMMLLLGPIQGDSNNEENLEEVIEGTKLTKLDSISKDVLLQVHDEARKYYIDLDIDPAYNRDLTTKIQKGNLKHFSESEKIQLSIELMMFRNKVTHIYEMVKAYGTSSQIRYDRRKDLWRRKQSIAAKHSHSYSVHPLTGACTKGEEHSPLIYIDDPRKYSPRKLRLHLSKILRGRDPAIIEGWIKAVISGEG